MESGSSTSGKRLTPLAHASGSEPRVHVRSCLSSRDPEGVESRSLCSLLNRFWILVPSMECRQVARVPSLAESRSLQIPVGADLARHGPQVAPEVDDRGAPPEPIAVIDAMDDESGLEHECVRDHRIMLRVGVFRDIEILLNLPVGVGEEGPLGAQRRAELLESVVVIGGDGDNLCVSHGDLRVKCGKLQMLLVFFRAVMAARKRQNQGIIALEFAEPARGVGVIGQLIVRKNVSGYEVIAHDLIPFTDAIGCFGDSYRIDQLSGPAALVNRASLGLASIPHHAIRSTHCARHAGATNGSAKYCVSRATLSPRNSMMLTV